jgi:hypothetical protein
MRIRFHLGHETAKPNLPLIISARGGYLFITAPFRGEEQKANQ